MLAATGARDRLLDDGEADRCGDALAYDPGMAATIQEVGGDEARIEWESCGPVEAEEHVGYYTHAGGSKLVRAQAHPPEPPRTCSGVEDGRMTPR